MTDNPDTPSLDLEPASPEVKQYQRQKEFATILSMVLSFVLLVMAAFWLAPWWDQVIRARLGDNRWLRLPAVAFMLGLMIEVVTLPIAFWSGFVLEHKHQLSNQTFRAWVWKRFKGYLIGGPLGLCLLFGLYAVMWYGGSWWWVIAAAGFLMVTLVLGRLAPILILPLFYKVTHLEQTDLLDRLQHLADGTGLAVEGVYRLHLSEETKKANAALTGLGKSRRALLGDTLLNEFTPEEIEVVFAHELGHHVHRHLPKMVALSVLLTAAGLFLVDVCLRSLAGPLGYAGFADPAALPLVLLVLSLFSLVLMPAENALSRLFERQCDQYALDRTQMPAAYRSAFCKLARMNKADPDPHPVVVWFLYDHPPIRERLAMAVE